MRRVLFHAPRNSETSYHDGHLSQSAVRYADVTHGAAETSVILLDVGGMKCGGCAAGVKRRLLERPEVHSAAVNLVTGSAVVTVSASAAPSFAAELGEHITSQVATPHHLLAAT